MPQNERLRVWNEKLKKTSGGLTKKDLMKNKRGKIVSRKKSEGAKKNKDKNNLGNWLRSKGEKFLSKGVTAENIIRKGKPGRKAFKKEKGEEEEIPEEKQSEVKTKPKKVAAPKKAAPKKVAPKKVAPKKVAPKKAPKVVKAPPKITKTAPLQAGQEKDFTKVSVGNIITKEMKDYKELVDFYHGQGESKETLFKEMGKPPPGYTLHYKLPW